MQARYNLKNYTNPKPLKRPRAGRPSIMDEHLLGPIKNMVAMGFTARDIGMVLGISRGMVKQWTFHRPDVRKASDEGREVAKGYLVASMMKAACGYDYDETETYYVTDKLTGKLSKEPDKIVVKHKHQPANGWLAAFVASNLMPENFKREMKYQIEEKKQNLSLKLSGKIEEEKITKLAGLLTSAVEGENSERGEVCAVDTEVNTGEPRVSQEVPQQVGPGQESPAGFCPVIT